MAAFGLAGHVDFDVRIFQQAVELRVIETGGDGEGLALRISPQAVGTFHEIKASKRRGRQRRFGDELSLDKLSELRPADFLGRKLLQVTDEDSQAGES